MMDKVNIFKNVINILNLIIQFIVKLSELILKMLNLESADSSTKMAVIAMIIQVSFYLIKKIYRQVIKFFKRTKIIVNINDELELIKSI